MLEDPKRPMAPKPKSVVVSLEITSIAQQERDSRDCGSHAERTLDAARSTPRPSHRREKGLELLCLPPRGPNAIGTGVTFSMVVPIEWHGGPGSLHEVDQPRGSRRLL